jgi:hypothetical protein
MIGLPRLGPSRSSVRGDTGGMRFVPHLLLALALAACGGDGDAVRHHERARAALLAGEILEAEEAVRLAREAAARRWRRPATSSTGTSPSPGA